MQNPLDNISLLVDFEAAARWNSFKLAAQELHKTPAAVSQNVRQLEQLLRFDLFVRHARHIVLTEKGVELAQCTARLLRELNLKIRSLQEDHGQDSLRISCTHSFAMKWLVPRLHRFAQAYPRWDIRLESDDQPVDMATCDVALRYRRASAMDEIDTLWRERHVVAYSPMLVTTQSPDLAQLCRFPLLYEGTPENWIRLLDEYGMLNRRYDYAGNFSHAGLLVQATVAAQGVALLPFAIAHEDLQQGRLVRLPQVRLDSAYGYDFMCDPRKRGHDKIRQFRDWLEREFAAMQDDYARAS
jgi:LysR family glycine cleavage system transcriptional activator